MRAIIFLFVLLVLALAKKVKVKTYTQVVRPGNNGLHWDPIPKKVTVALP